MKKIVFLTGTRADFGKLKSLICICLNDFEVHIFATGMHLNSKYGFTINEIQKCNFPNIFMFYNHRDNMEMDLILSMNLSVKTIPLPSVSKTFFSLNVIANSSN